MRAIVIGLGAAAAGVAVFWDGGFDAVPQWTFAALALAAGLAALGLRRASVANAPVVVLLAIAALQALSAAWTIDSASAAIRAGAVTAGYAGLVVAASSETAARLGAGLAVAAGITGAMGLVSAAFLSTVYAERLEGAWRPEGPFGYPPALALVQVFALPVLLGAMARARPPLAALAAGTVAVAAGVLVLNANRLSLGLAVLVAGIALVVPERTVGARRLVVAGAVLVPVSAGILFHELLGGFTSRYVQAEAGRFLELAAIVVGAAAAWLVIRQRLGAEPPAEPARVSRTVLLAAGAAVVAAALAAALLSTGALSARRFPSQQGFTHGRSWMWSAGYHTAVERPLYGYGASGFYKATVSRQPGHGRVTRFAHDLPLELAVETGIGGFLLALALYAAVGRSLWHSRGSPELWLLGPAVAAFLVSNLVDWSWHLAGAGALFALALGGLLSARRPALRP